VPSIGSSFGSRRLGFELGGDGDPIPDVLRTGCPGPTERDVLFEFSAESPLSGPTLATASVPAAWLARRAFQVQLRNDGRFSTVGYTGTRHARFTLGLLRRKLKVTESRQRVP
jgi:hypothetical protein